MKNRNVAFVARHLLALWLASIFGGLFAANPAGSPVQVEGYGFTVQKLDEKVLGFGNRKYLLGEVPAFLRGWQFTRLNGGERATITATPGSDGEVYLITSGSRKGVPLDGWKPVEAPGLHYTAKAQTKLELFRKSAKSGVAITVPQGNWSGCMIAAPELVATLRPRQLDHRWVPGVVITHLPSEKQGYVGSPSIARLPEGAYVASHDVFGPGGTGDLTVLFNSRDQGKTWQKFGELKGQWWSTLFVHRGALYIIGPNRSAGQAVIRRSLDGGKTWTNPVDGKSGLLLAVGKYHCAPVPVTEFNGRLWRAMEDLSASGLRAFMMSVPADADLLDATKWACSNRLEGNTNWLKGDFGSWREGNAVIDPHGQLLNIIRVETPGYPEKAALIRHAPDGLKASFDPVNDFVDFPGGSKKFTIRYDPPSKLYWSLVSAVPGLPPEDRRPSRVRNTLALISSPDLRNWTIRDLLLHHPDPAYHGFQYVDWLFEGEDIIAVSRTSYDDGLEGAHNFHDANYLTFHRVTNFRQRQKP